MQDTVPSSAPSSFNTDEPPPQAPPVRVLTRSRDRMIGGVAAGIGEYFDVDPTIIRLGLVLATLLSGGIVLLAYVVLWVIMPDPPASALLASGQTGAPAGASIGRNTNGAFILGIILIAVGGIALMSQFPMFHLIGSGLARIWWPSMLILIGAVLVLSRARD